MSGGHFGYAQLEIGNIANEIENVIANNHSTDKNDWGDPVGYGFSAPVIEEFAIAVRLLRRAAVYAQRADWLLSSDDSEDSFLQRLAEDLEKLK